MFKEMSISRIGDDDPMCPHAMVGLKNDLIHAFVANGVDRPCLTVRGFLIPERGFVDLHVDTETPYYDVWVTILNRYVFVVRRHRKDTYRREKMVFSTDMIADGYRQGYINKIIGGVLYMP